MMENFYYTIDKEQIEDYKRLSVLDKLVWLADLAELNASVMRPETKKIFETYRENERRIVID